MWFVWLVLDAIVGGWGGAFIGATAGGLLAIGYLAPVLPGETERRND